METSAETNVLVRDQEQFIQLLSIDDWDAMSILASVSSDPRSFRELALAWLRYRADEPLELKPWQPCQPERVAGDWILIDLACQRLVSNCPDAIPQERTAFQQREGKWDPSIGVVWCNFPPWWQRSIESELTKALPPIPEFVEPVDFRGILYGRTMARELGRRMSRIVTNESVPTEYLRWDDLPCESHPSDQQKEVVSRWHELTVRVHADWLMTPLDQLDGQPPRTFLHRGREWVQWEVENRQAEWSRLKRAPRPLDRDTYAYRYGPMGLDEVVVYFDLCREVIHAGWKRMCAQQIDVEQLSREMWDHSKEWLANGPLNGETTAPTEIIECNRRHMPQLADGTHLDCDCPLCRMAVDDTDRFYPTFAMSDGHHLELDDEFAFSLCETYDMWQLEQAQDSGIDEDEDDESVQDLLERDDGRRLRRRIGRCLDE